MEQINTKGKWTIIQAKGRKTPCQSIGIFVMTAPEKPKTPPKDFPVATYDRDSGKFFDEKGEKLKGMASEYVFSRPDMRSEIMANGHVIEQITRDALRRAGRTGMADSRWLSGRKAIAEYLGATGRSVTRLGKKMASSSARIFARWFTI